MNLRSLLFPPTALCALAASTLAVAAPSIQGRQVSVQSADVQQYLDHSFPQTHAALGGLLQLSLSHPQVHLPPGERVNLDVDLALATAGGTPTPLGSVALSSALRYDTAKQGLYLEQPSIDDFRPASSGGRLDSSTRQLLNAWLVDYARKQPIYRIDPAISNTLGNLQVESAGVRDGRLVITFNHDVDALLPATALPGN
jgi:hypothetical protein